MHGLNFGVNHHTFHAVKSTTLQDILKIQHSMTASKSLGESCLQVLLQCSSDTKMFYSRPGAIVSTLNVTQGTQPKLPRVHIAAVSIGQNYGFSTLHPATSIHRDFVNSGFWLIVYIYFHLKILCWLLLIGLTQFCKALIAVNYQRD